MVATTLGKVSVKKSHRSYILDADLQCLVLRGLDHGTRPCTIADTSSPGDYISKCRTGGRPKILVELFEPKQLSLAALFTETEPTCCVWTVIVGYLPHGIVYRAYKGA